jgi:hypothetical protein
MISEIYTSRKLKTLLGMNFDYVLSLGICEAQPKAKRELRKYKLVIDELPTKQEFFKLLSKHFEAPIESIIEASYSDMECLGEEIRDWFDNMGENLQCSAKGEELEECADSLEYAERVELDNDFPTPLKEHKLSVIPSPKVTSRRDRLDEATKGLETVKEYLQEIIDTQDSDKAEHKLSDDEVENVEQVISELEETVDNMADVNFPSMY